ncbi:hypothetical protein [Peribacillus sp. NPDC097895]|uniref:hypothetical protein n=1 Tax=Peribacillus sp. NPDC097895 TaxID=3390619 RepID=UPI003D0503EA
MLIITHIRIIDAGIRVISIIFPLIERFNGLCHSFMEIETVENFDRMNGRWPKQFSLLARAAGLEEAPHSDMQKRGHRVIATTEITKAEDMKKQEEGLKNQFGPGDMIEKMIEIIPADHHKFRTVHPEKTEKQMKETEKNRWGMEI